MLYETEAIQNIKPNNSNNKRENNLQVKFVWLVAPVNHCIGYQFCCINARCLVVYSGFQPHSIQLCKKNEINLTESDFKAEKSVIRTWEAKSIFPEQLKKTHRFK
mmetsp:Transcript_29833/g.43801  ORF Transcript_29833/g.43801 Transcript_29833/m.43801 type:complete len:105 (-) Transcript_29833:1553-1867(-)